MATLAQKAFRRLLGRLRNRAKEERRSLNQQAIRMLEEAQEPEQHTYAEPQSLLMLSEPGLSTAPAIDDDRGAITTDEIEAAIEEGLAQDKLAKLPSPPPSSCNRTPTLHLRQFVRRSRR